MLRVYICPVIGTGVKGNGYRTPPVDYGYQTDSFIPSKPDGSPAFTWSLVVVRADDFTAIEADTRCDDLFGGDLPAAVQTADDLRAMLHRRTVSDVPLARRNAITAVLDKYGVDRTDFTGQTILWRVLQRVASTLFGSRASELSDSFPSF